MIAGCFKEVIKPLKRNWDPFPINPTSIDAVVLTHAHIDHTGYIPLLVKNGFKGKIYCSQATYELCAILLIDYGNLQEEEAKRYNERKDPNAPADAAFIYESMMQNIHYVFFMLLIMIRP